MDPKQPIESPPSDDLLEPTAAHFREAARLAAARVRSAITANDPSEPSPAQSEQPDEGAINAGVFEEAAKEHARTMSECEPEQPRDTETIDKSKTPDTTAELDERLHLGARMLRAFESQIQRLERAAHQAHLATDAISTPRPESDPTELETRVVALAERVSKAASASEEVLVTVEAAIERSNSTANALASSLETANALKVGIEETTQTLSSCGQEQEARASVILHRLDVVLKAMETKLSCVLQIEEAISACVERAEQLTTQSIKTDQSPEHEPPVIEIEPLQKKTTQEQTTSPTESTMVSYGTLSVDPKRLERTQRLQRYLDRA